MGRMKNWMIEREERGFDDIDKYICPNCVQDKYMRDWISKNAKQKTRCDYCGENSNCVSMNDFQHKIKEVITTYYSIAENTLPYDNEEDRYYGTTYDTNDIIEDLNYELEANDEVILDLKKSFDNNLWCNKEPFRLSETEVLLSSWNYFAHTVKYENRYFFFTQKDDYDSEIYSPLTTLNIIGDRLKNFKLIKELAKNTLFYRARSVENLEESYNESSLGSPPFQKAAANRMSAEGISAFYATDTKETAITEIKNKNKNAIVAQFENLKKLKYIDLTAIEAIPIPSFFDVKNKRTRDAILFLKGLNNDLRRPIEELKAIEYVPTQIFAEYCRRIIKVDGIKYHSAKDPNGACYILFYNNEDCQEASCEYKLFKEPKLRLINYEKIQFE